MITNALLFFGLWVKMEAEKVKKSTNATLWVKMEADSVANLVVMINFGHFKIINCIMNKKMSVMQFPHCKEEWPAKRRSTLQVHGVRQAIQLNAQNYQGGSVGVVSQGQADSRANQSSIG